jgi:surface protein
MFYRDANGNFTYTTDWGTTQWALKVWDTRSIGDWTSAWGTTVDGCQDESGVLTSINTVSNGAFAPPAWSDSTGVNYCTLTFNAKTHEYMWTHLDDQQPTEYQTVGIVGDFNGWGNDVEMTQIAPHNWYIRYTFPQRTSFKLRANNAWDANWGYNEQTTRSYYCINGINGANIGVEADEYDIYLNDITGQINMVPTREFSVLTVEDVEITMYKSADVATQCSLRGGLGYYSMSNAQYNNAGDMLVNTPNAPAVLPDTEGHVTIPAEANGYSVVAIPAYAFNGTKISGVTLPAGIVDYQDNAFAGCASLDTITSLRQSPVAIPDSTFSMAHYEHAVLFVPEGSIDAYKATDGWKNFGNIYEIGTVILNPEAYAVLTGDSILTFYYDTQKESRGGMDVRPFLNASDVSWSTWAYNITSVAFNDTFAEYYPTSTAYWFYGFGNLTAIDGLGNLKTDSVTTMSYMFYDCRKLASLDLSQFKTDNVTSMYVMFTGCSSLIELDLTSFNTANVGTMIGMFEGSSALKTVNLSSFNTANVKQMRQMFNECTNLTTIFVGSGWTTGALEDYGTNMFHSCTNLVGGQGTTYDAEHVDAAYAHIDGGTPNPGYFSLQLAKGDANGDGNINIADAVATVTDILGQPTESAFYKYAADMNNDQEIDIFDVTMIVNAAFDAASPAPAMTRGSADNIMMEHISMTADADYIYLGVDQPERFTATQFDVTLPEGMELVDARLASATTDHQLSFVKRGDNEYRVIGLSMSNTTFRSIDGQLIKLEVSDIAVDSDVKMSNVLFVTPSNKTVTAISECLNGQKAAGDSLYDLKGQRLSKQQLGKGIYIMNHKKVIIK